MKNSEKCMMQYVDTSSYIYECHTLPLVTGSSVYSFPGALTVVPFHGTSKGHGIL